MSDELYIGASGWSYPDWEGVFYPAGAGRGLNRLAYYAEFFDAVEINTTFYRPAKPEHCRKWARDAAGNPRFLFTVKLWRRFTHDREEPWTQADVDACRRGLDELAAAGKLGAVLAQFPWSFRNAERPRAWLARLAEAFAEYPKAIEVRHASWLCDAALRFFRDLGWHFCNIDQPPARDSIGPTAAAEGGLAYFRLHGRNAANWFRPDAGRDERYDYLYSLEELQPWAERIDRARRAVKEVFVMMNNHYRGQAAVNAIQLKRMLGRDAPAPVCLAEQYPVLKDEET